MHALIHIAVLHEVLSRERLRTPIQGRHVIGHHATTHWEIKWWLSHSHLWFRKSRLILPQISARILQNLST